jgi:uncharacterized protein (TIGR03435 family)
MSIRELIRRAYDLPRFDRVLGGPEWIDTERYDFTGRAETESLVPRRMLMLQAFLAERLKLVVRREARDMPAFALVLARSDGRLGPRLQRSQMDCAAVIEGRRGGTPPPTPPGARPVCSGRGSLGSITAGGITIAQLAERISGNAGLPVIERTGLSGYFDLDLNWLPDDVALLVERQGRIPEGPRLATALEEQLGLRLEPSRGPIEVLVVDRVERPTEN